jgi:hypothetical protein
MEQSTSWVADVCWASRAILRILWNQKVYHFVHKSPAVVLIPNQMNSSHTLNLFLLRFILILSSQIGQVLPNGHVPSGLSTKTLCAFLFCHLVLAHPIVSRSIKYQILIIIIIFGEEYESWSFSLCRCLCSSGPNSLITLFLYTLSPWFFLNVRDRFSRPDKTTAKIIVLCIL